MLSPFTGDGFFVFRAKNLKKGKELSIYNNEKTYNYRGFEKTLEREKNDVRKSIDKSEFR